MFFSVTLTGSTVRGILTWYDHPFPGLVLQEVITFWHTDITETQRHIKNILTKKMGYLGSTNISLAPYMEHYRSQNAARAVS